MKLDDCDASDIYTFVAWAGCGKDEDKKEKITATSLTLYLYGLKPWHTLHNVMYPHHMEERVKLMLKASGKQDTHTPQWPPKLPVLLADLLNLSDYLEGHAPKAEATRDLGIVAFWGMAWLSELT
ncbi:hypothetical protein PCASD_11127 [Puccinia coronata f. sp. avenae]|uniref:Uncharacterized protein n=1 Tax=Puccinia coronata f. sp. avenae TaxID=200324 RepID=A0A2N5UHE9_9BASI|nr:hypothetical protein PCASD_13451 [Puccinia coronata f. sp. avenae]PLW37158.1 hypothetical protein PCASD_11127 [Puccinia coronata f. sp. avenae]